MKKEKIMADIQEIIVNEDLSDYSELTDALLMHNDAEKVLAALIKHAFAHELNVDNYSKIKNFYQDRDFNLNTNSKTRLFITMGKLDKMTRKKLALFIEEKAGVPQNLVRNIEVFESYSFITVPFQEAEIILEVFKRFKYKKRSLIVEKAEKGKIKKRNKRRK